MNKMQKILEILNKFLVFVFLFLIQIYRRCISPALGPRCRFYPSCSEYSQEAFKKYGFAMGIVKTSIRVCKCHPFHKGGVDFP